MSWDPDQYNRYSQERALPFHHLVCAVDQLEPTTVVDLGCGTGELTATLAGRWPEASIVGVDSSPEMIARAEGNEIPGRLVFECCDAATWKAPRPIDLVLSNACFHWIADHRALFDHLLPQLAPGGTLAFQVPANHGAPSHSILRDLCSSTRWRDRLDGHPRTGVRELQWYLEDLGGRGFAVSAWQTTYHHILHGDNPVLDWVRGTTLRPILARLSDPEQNEFQTEFGALLREAYPETGGSTLFPFTRLFVVASHT
jgi:trans-aconitate 2-methyltransferase